MREKKKKNRACLHTGKRLSDRPCFVLPSLPPPRPPPFTEVNCRFLPIYMTYYIHWHEYIHIHTYIYIMEFDKTSCAALGFFHHKPSPMIPPLQETFTSAIFVNFFFFIKKILCLHHQQEVQQRRINLNWLTKEMKSPDPIDQFVPVLLFIKKRNRKRKNDVG